MKNIDKILDKLLFQSNMVYLEDYYDLYDFVPNEKLKKALAAFHTQLNKWFSIMNDRIIKRYDEDGNEYYDGGYFLAQDSRDYLSIVETIDKLRSQLSSTEYAFKFANNDYDDRIRQCRRFVEPRNGSSIPKGLEPLTIEEYKPVFEIINSVSISYDTKTLYAHLQSIGQGSYACVFSYLDPVYNIKIVLKRARKELDNKELARFKQEFDILNMLNSPYIVKVYSFDEKRNEYLMEYMDETIYDYVSKNNTVLNLIARKRLITQLCHGFKYIHSKKILHRDISLTNVFVKHYDDVDIVKIGDFGLVKLPNSTLTSMQSEIKGSMNDPDLINVGFDKYDMRHETFALTRLCYFILTGRTNINKQKDGLIKNFWFKGTNPNIANRFKSVDELLYMVNKITELNK